MSEKEFSDLVKQAEVLTVLIKDEKRRRLWKQMIKEAKNFEKAVYTSQRGDEK